MRRTVTPLTIEIPAPCAWVTSNTHGHWRVRHQLTREWRRSAHLWALDANATAFPGPVHIDATIHKMTRRRFDLDGHMPTLKACVDGIRDAGVLPEDHIGVVPSITLRAGEPRDRAWLVITITPTEGATP